MLQKTKAKKAGILVGLWEDGSLSDKIACYGLERHAKFSVGQDQDHVRLEKPDSWGKMHYSGYIHFSAVVSHQAQHKMHMIILYSYLVFINDEWAYLVTTGLWS